MQGITPVLYITDVNALNLILLLQDMFCYIKVEWGMEKMMIVDGAYTYEEAT